MSKNFVFDNLKKGKYKYVLRNSYEVQTKIKGYRINGDYFKLYKSGNLVISQNYAWDGATLFPDTKEVMRGSCVHDCLFQMLRESIIPQDPRNWGEIFKLSNKTFVGICKEDKMYWITRKIIYFFITNFGKKYARPKKNI